MHYAAKLWKLSTLFCVAVFACSNSKPDRGIGKVIDGITEG
jgi:hypothetical protein